MSSKAWPPEFDVTFYQRQYPDLQSMSPETAAEHYEGYGRTEGRVATSAATRPGFLDLVPRNARILEIGPGHRPCFSGSKVKYFDVHDAAGLRARAESVSEDPDGAPSKVHYQSPESDFGIVPDQSFDVVFSSHAIEHQTDLIRHLNDVARVLAPGGAFYVICPDKRYCFDRHIRASTIGDVIEAYTIGRRVHRVADVVDAVVLSSHNDPAQHWRETAPLPEIQQHLVTHAIKAIEEAKGGYIDVHAWRMTPQIFKQITDMVYKLGYSKLKPVRVYDTPFGSNEFCAILSPDA